MSYPRFPVRTECTISYDSPNTAIPDLGKLPGLKLVRIGANKESIPCSNKLAVQIISGNVPGSIALFPQSAGIEAADVDTGGISGAKRVIEALSTFTDQEFLVIPSKTAGRYHVYYPIEPGKSGEVNTSPKWSLDGNGGEIKGGNSRITLYHPKTVLNYAISVRQAASRVPPELARSELCGPPKRFSSGPSKAINPTDHDTARAALLSVFSGVKEGHITDIDAEVLVDEITDKAIRAGRKRDEIERLARDARKYVDSTESDQVEAVKSSERIPDIDLAGYIVAKYGPLIRFNRDSGHYLSWVDWRNPNALLSGKAGLKWAESNPLPKLSRELVRRYGHDDKDRLYYGSAIRANAVESFVRHMVGAESSDFDSDPLSVGFNGGRVKLRSPEIDQSKPEMMITKSVRCKPEASKCSIFDRFLEETVGKDILKWFRRYLGYCLTGLTREHKVLFLYGPGGTGKSTLMRILLHIWRDYGGSIAKHVLFPGRYGTGHLAFIAMLVGKRLAFVPETGSYDRLNDSLFKSLSGGDTITANYMHRNPFDFKNTAKIIVITNNKPNLSGFDTGIQRRLILISCRHRPKSQDQDLLLKMKSESPGILFSLIRESREYLSNGLPPLPNRAARDTAAHLQAQNYVFRFVSDILESSETESVPMPVVFALFRAWCGAKGERLKSQATLHRDMESAGYSINGDILEGHHAKKTDRSTYW